ncbi:hypothetical protein TNCV_2302461 [Trichonephila clavipes]|nr:hypothetical protein TNCV_2302461 [Trichonephila clavipes]
MPSEVAVDSRSRSVTLPKGRYNGFKVVRDITSNHIPTQTRKTYLSQLTHTCSIGLKSGEYAGQFIRCKDVFYGYPNGVTGVVVTESEEQVVNDNDESNILISQLPCNNILNASEQCNTIHITLFDLNSTVSKNENDSKQSSFSYSSHSFDQSRGVMWSDASDKADLLDEGIEIQKLIEETPEFCIPHSFLWKSH